MREIKFCGWDTRKNKMYSAEEMGRDELTINPDGRGFVNVSGDSSLLSSYCTHIIPLQFTGLRDKNGVEIYEGDIVRWTSLYVDAQEIAIGEVTFFEGCWFIQGQRHNGPLNDCLMVVVISNIYNTPELMEVNRNAEVD